MGQLSNTERIARELMKHYYPELHQWHSYRPDWLQNPETGKPLEIDIFIPDLQAGLELNGIQHGRPIDRFHKDFAAFEKQQRHDMLKIERCNEFGVKLYRLTIFDLTQKPFEAFLRRFEQDNRLIHPRYLAPPLELYAQAEKLSRMKFRPRNIDAEMSEHLSIQMSVWQRIWKWLNE